MKKNLTNRVVKALPLAMTPEAPDPTKSQYIVRDETLRGFFCVIGRETKTFTCQFDLAPEGGKRKTSRRSLGRYGEIDASDARKEAEALLGGIKTGRVKRLRGKLTLEEAFDHYRAGLQQQGRAQTSIRQYEHLYTRVLSPWAKVTLRSLAEDRLMVRRRHSEIGKDFPVLANLAMKLLRAVYLDALTIETDLPPISPTHGIKFYRQERRETGMQFGDLRDWEIQRRALPCPVRRSYHMFMLLSGSRPNALRQAEWSWIDFDEKVIRFPKHAMKSGREFTVPLSQPMIHCLAEAREAGEQVYPENCARFIFPALSRTGHLSRAKEKRSKLSHWNGDLRQSWVNIAKEIGLDGHAARLLLNHSVGSVHDGYGSSSTTSPLCREAQDRMSARIMEGLNSAAG